MPFADSAFKHGITEDQIRHVIEHWQPPFLIASARDPATDVLLFVGEDAAGVPLEVIAVEEQRWDGEWELVVLHAMRLRPVYRHFYEEALQWRQHD